MIRTNLAAIALAAALAPLAASAADAPGVFRIPGTDSTITFNGYVQLDTTLDFGGRVEDIENNDWATILPGVPDDDSPRGNRANPQLYMTARTSRFSVVTSTPTKALGNVGVRLEGDFNGPNGFQSETFTNSVQFRLRHAYGTVGNLLVGQTWTTFLDLGAAPDTVDFNGPGSLALVRNPMIRYTLGIGQGIGLTLAAENARGAQFGTNAAAGSREKIQTVPDIHANLTYSGSWGHISVRGVSQYYRDFNETLDVEPPSEWAFAGAVSGSLKLGADTLVAQVSGGPGIGRYMLNALGTGASGAGGYTLNASNELDLWTVWAYHVGFTHVWNSAFRSNLVWSQTFIDDPEIDNTPATNAVQEQMMQAFVNTFWSFTRTAAVGLEYSYGQWKSFSPGNTAERQGTQNRVTATFHYNFF
jgi:hypothetical protein